MSITIKQFRKKVEDLNDSWLFLKHIEDLDEQERQTLVQHGILDLDNVVLIHFKNKFDWFLLTLSGIYIFQEEVLKFFKYKEIAKMDIMMDWRLKASNVHPKIAADTLSLQLLDGEQLYLKCSDVGSVYTLSRAVRYGICFIATEQ